MLDDRSYMREPDWRPEKTVASRISLCLGLIILNVLFFILQNRSPEFTESWALRASNVRGGEIWKLLTFQFLHGSFFHLLINCLMIWFAGRQIEETLGKLKFLSLYLVAGVFGGLLQCSLTWVRLLPDVGVVGASAGVSGIIAAFAMMLWNRELTFLIMFIIPVTMRAKYLLLVLVVIDVVGLAAGGTGIAHGAHLGGVLWGVFFVLMFVQGGTWTGAEPWLKRIKERLNSGHERKVVTIDGGARAYSRKNLGSASVEEASFVEAEIDPILDKISENGIQSLNDRERLILEQARKNMGR